MAQEATAPPAEAQEPKPAEGQAPKEATTPKEGQEPQGAEPTTFDAEYVKTLRDEAAKSRKRAQEAETKVTEHEDAQKSELEKAQGKADKAEQAKADAEAKLLRFEVAQEKEVPAKLVPLLTAADKEGLEAQADLILENVKEGTKPNFDGGVQTPAPDPKKPEDQHNDLALKLLGRSPNT